MSRVSKKVLLVFVIATLVGSCLHFVHALLPNPITALFSPVNESLWEHVKILFWPYLVGALVLSRGEGKERLGARCLSLLLICALMLVAGYLYHIVLGGEALVFDVVLYVLLMALGFVLPVLLRHPIEGRARDILILLVVALGVTILLFTFLPPDQILFTDLSGANTWSRLPC